ncbi:hypothetical protein GWK47_046891 [Chionoecetes opilio]|uniref:Uncharacterized protein n=1 Tax=Chionoecetes opilio TaxID=41210 RepID=A0A8J4YE79_CHIOP|nr:hypothetical protein GWK47_046891 [Chionoecetes opilio]
MSRNDRFSLVRSSVAASAGETISFVARFARFAGLAPPLLRILHLKQKAEVLGWTTARTRAAPTDEEAASLFLFFRAEKAAAFFQTKRLPRLLSARTESTPPILPRRPGSRFGGGGTLCPPGCHHGSAFPCANPRRGCREVPQNPFLSSWSLRSPIATFLGARTPDGASQSW